MICYKIMKHSIVSQNSGTINIKRHFESNNCKLKKRFNFFNQQKLNLFRVNLKSNAK